MSWGYDEETGEFGLWTVRVWSSWASDSSRVPFDTDVTFVRDAPTQITEMGESDPFGPDTATLVFPTVTGFDSFGEGGTVPWMRDYENVDIYFLPCTEDSWSGFHGHTEQTVLNPLTNSTYLYVHEYNQDGSLVEPLWEGWFAQITPTTTQTTVLCKGALYQLDRYYAKPIHPLRPKPIEQMIARYFDPTRRGLWTQALEMDWTDLTRVYTQWDHNRLTSQGGIIYTPTATYDPAYGSVPVGGDPSEMQLGHPWTTWLTRQTGDWSKALTGYIQSQLGLMYAIPDEFLREYNGVTEPSWGPNITNGDQWTITMDAGRKPRMYLRRQQKSPTVILQYGAPGVTDNLAREAEQGYNVVFGQGTGADGIEWNEIVPIDDASFITWAPLFPEADADNLYVGWERGNDLSENYDGYAAQRERELGQAVSERYISDFPSGVNEDDARQIARMLVDRDSDPGWTGSIVLKIDAKDSSGNALSRWRIKPGDVVLLQHFQGHATATQGVNKFHVSRVVRRPMTGEVELTVDTKFRDQLSVQHAIASGKDSLSIVLSNRTGQMMNNVQDLLAPWSPNKGAGVMPTSSYKRWTRTESFPYEGFTTTVGNRPRDLFKAAFRGTNSGFPGGSHQVVKMIETPNGGDSSTLSLENTLEGPLETHGLYIPVQAGAVNKSRRWAFFPVLLSAAGTIYRTEFAAYDRDGNLAPVEFSVTMYDQDKIDQNDMPRLDTDDVGEFSALWDGAFEKVQRNGAPWPVPENHWGNDRQRMGWGTYDRPCGYSPGVKDFDSLNPTGMMVDGGPWQYDMYGTREWGTYATGEYDKVPRAAISWWVAIYAQIPGHVDDGDPTGYYNWVYFRGRVYRSNPGIN